MFVWIQNTPKPPRKRLRDHEPAAFLLAPDKSIVAAMYCRLDRIEVRIGAESGEDLSSAADHKAHLLYWQSGARYEAEEGTIAFIRSGYRSPWLKPDPRVVLDQLRQQVRELQYIGL